jgi:hypothetical protein
MIENRLPVNLAPVLLASLLALVGVGCPPEEDKPQVLEHSHAGSLTLVYTLEAPPLEATANMAVSVDVYGDMTITPGTLNYDGEQIDGDVKLRRSGSVELRPTGAWFEEGGRDRFSVKEHGDGEERFQQWGWDGVQWVGMLDQSMPIAWNGGLVFLLDDAVFTGSTVQANLGLGLVRWTLRLTPSIE